MKAEEQGQLELDEWNEIDDETVEEIFELMEEERTRDTMSLINLSREQLALLLLECLKEKGNKETVHMLEKESGFSLQHEVL